MQLKKWLCTALMLALFICLLPEVAMASPGGHGVITGQQKGQMTVSLASAESGTTGPALAPGNHERWIDRIDRLPDYALNFYTWLENNARSGGALINPTKAMWMDTDTYAYRFYTYTGSADFTYTNDQHQTAAENAAVTAVGDSYMTPIRYATAVYGAFDRDHPEVFWLNGYTICGYNITYNYAYSNFPKIGTVNYTVELLFYLKGPDFDVRQDRYQSVSAITADMELQNSAIEEILSGCPDGSVYEKVRYLNHTLTHRNAYNSAVAMGSATGASANAWKGICALTGHSGTDGPVCEGYSRAMMILCRELGIPCVLAEGQVKATVSDATGAHMWNYIRLADRWYAVDTTWNDPVVTGKGDEVISGYENEEWLLVGSDTVLRGMTFGTSHVLTNYTTVDSLSYINGPVLSADAYVPEPVVTVPTLTLQSPTLEFKDMIRINAFYTAENTQDVVEMGMITYKQKTDVIDINTADYVIPGAQYDAASGRYFAASQGIHAKYLADTVYLACYARLTDGSYVYTKLAPYSPITYATNQLKKSTDMNLKQLVAAMLNYGAAAQVYFGHNVQNLANASMTEEQMALPETYRQDMVSAVPAASVQKQGIFANNKGFSVRRPAVSFEGAFCINYFFTPVCEPADGIVLYYWNEADYVKADVLTPQNATGSVRMDGTGTSEYRGDIEGICAKNLSQSVYVAAVYSDGTTDRTSGVLGYSIGAYCSGQVSKGGDIAALAEATAVYGYHAKQYFG